jgi:hypothetical protein
MLATSTVASVMQALRAAFLRTTSGVGEIQRPYFHPNSFSTSPIDSLTQVAPRKY